MAAMDPDTPSAAQRLPLHDLHAGAGAKFDAPCGWELPLDYGDAGAEYRAVRHGTGLIDRGHFGLLEVTGRDRAAFLHAMLTNDVKALGAGQGCAAALLDVHGKVQVFVWLWALEDRLLVVTPPGLAAKTNEALDTYLFSEKAYFRDATGELFFLVLAGREALAVTDRVCGASPPDAPWSHVTATVDGASVRLVRGGGETGESEVWFAGEAAEAPRIWKAIVDAGARPVGLTAFESLRVETGTPLFGHDADESVLLPEIPFADRVSYTKGCYIGQEVVVRIRDRGHVNRMLRGLVLEGDQVARHDAAVLAGADEVGRVTSAAWSFGLERPIALAMIRRQHADPGTPVSVAVGGGAVAPARVSALPFSR
jgi:folate-binding protein YgfZ